MRTDIKRGDRVRVVIEDTVSRISANGTIYLENDVPGEDADMWFAPGDPNVVSVEKVESPVEVFGPGDVVIPRNQSFGGTALRFLGTGGYFNAGDNTFYRYDDRDSGAYRADQFTSESFQKVQITTVPF